MTLIEVLRRFKTTTTQSSHIGQPGYDSDDDWHHFLDKYQEPCLLLLRTQYPHWADDAEDAWMMAVDKIRHDWRIMKRKPGDSFRSVLANICRQCIWRMHNPHRLAAMRRFGNWFSVVSRPSGRRWNPEIMERLKDIIGFIRDDLLRPDYQNGRYFRYLNQEQLDLWRQVQVSQSSDTDLAARLGIPYKRLNRAKNNIDRWIGEEAVKIGKAYGLLEDIEFGR